MVTLEVTQQKVAFRQNPESDFKCLINQDLPSPWEQSHHELLVIFEFWPQVTFEPLWGSLSFLSGILGIRPGQHVQHVHTMRWGPIPEIADPSSGPQGSF